MPSVTSFSRDELQSLKRGVKSKTSPTQFELALIDSDVQELPLVRPELLRYEIPMSPASAATVQTYRDKVADIISQQSDKLIVMCGPCSLHDPDAALEYADLLQAVSALLSDDLVIVMRAYLEKPRTTVGWKGLINDPDMDDSFQINKGIRIARQLFSDITSKGMPIASELLDVFTPQFLADFLSVGAIGARTTESQLHRELASGLPFPIGFKNGTDGGLSVAIDAVESAASRHNYIGFTQYGLSAIKKTQGNNMGFVILRGGTRGPNFQAQEVLKARQMLSKRGRPGVVMVDISHGNSQKDHNNQRLVAKDISDQIRAGDTGIVGVMIESNLKSGRQDIPASGPALLERGVSITDACIDWDTTVAVLTDLAAAVRIRRINTVIEEYKEFASSVQSECR
ncbi:hypothetical protein B0O99DRAFT_706971 [Bisporella sp. PMI_857]|nr:hypothetical protein B0O99DRAFT_706971 [Bisporella sp. PMI_857]